MKAVRITPYDDIQLIYQVFSKKIRLVLKNQLKSLEKYILTWWIYEKNPAGFEKNEVVIYPKIINEFE